MPDFSGNVYGQQPVLEFYKYFCPVRKFNSMDELAALIHHAADESKAYFVGLNGDKIIAEKQICTCIPQKVVLYTNLLPRPGMGRMPQWFQLPFTAPTADIFLERGIYP